MNFESITAFIFAAGLGTRLRPLTDSVPKPLIKLNNKPIIEYTIEWYISLGIKEIIINIHYLPDQFNYLKDKYQNKVNIILVKEEEILGHGGAIYNSLDLISNEQILASNADTIIRLNEEDLSRLISKDLNLVLFRKDSGVLGFNENDGLIRIKNNLFSNQQETYSADYAGICNIRKSCLPNYHYQGGFLGFFGNDDLLENLISKGTLVSGIILKNIERIEVNSLEDLEVANINVRELNL